MGGSSDASIAMGMESVRHCVEHCSPSLHRGRDMDQQSRGKNKQIGSGSVQNENGGRRSERTFRRFFSSFFRLSARRAAKDIRDRERYSSSPGRCSSSWQSRCAPTITFTLLMVLGCDSKQQTTTTQFQLPYVSPPEEHHYKPHPRDWVLRKVPPEKPTLDEAVANLLKHWRELQEIQKNAPDPNQPQSKD